MNHLSPVDDGLTRLASRQRTCHKFFGYNGGMSAGVAQLVESELPKLVVAGSNPVARSMLPNHMWNWGSQVLTSGCTK